MIAALDVHYEDTTSSAWAAGIAFHAWTDVHSAVEKVIRVSEVHPYVPGQFFRRELPCLLASLRALPPVEVVIVDGYVWLGDGSQPGLGAHLYEALEKRIAVIGVAKSKFRGASGAQEITRGQSTRPLFISAAGMPLADALDHVRSMPGPHRLPTLLSRVDQLCRQGGRAS